MSADPTLLVEKDGHVATVTMNRPEAVNAFDLEMLCRMWDAWQMLDNAGKEGSLSASQYFVPKRISHPKC